MLEGTPGTATWQNQKRGKGCEILKETNQNGVIELTRSPTQRKGFKQETKEIKKEKVKKIKMAVPSDYEEMTTEDLKKMMGGGM